MKFYAIFDLVGIQVDDSYPWCDTIFLSKGVAEETLEAYEVCKKKIRVSFRKEIPMDDVRFIGDGAYIGQNVYVDQQFGVRIQKNRDGYDMTVSQECNEWLVIILELSLLETNHTLLHAAALEKDGDALLLPSWGGVGKTATVCRYVRQHGWRLLGDDLVIIGENRVLPFLKPFVIYPYHKDLFPELFRSGEKHIVKNMRFSSMMSRAIPSVKRLLRPFPRVLAFLRKHNPQSMRVPPQSIFAPEQLSNGGKVKRMVWLERTMGDETVFSRISADALSSRAVAVSSVELFASRLESVYHMCGCGMEEFDDVFGRMRDIFTEIARSAECGILEIPTSVQVSNVGEIIYQNLEQ